MSPMRSVVVGTAGHIDHGKSTLVRALTGIDPDRLQEEKARGITIDLGFAHAEFGDVRVAFVDVPGHERFIKNMLAGATGIDAVALVIAADESVMPQTREHFDICRLLGVRHGLVVLTKADLVDEDTLELATLEVRELVHGSFLEGRPVIPVSAADGRGLDQLRGALVSLAADLPMRPGAGILRLPIDRAFSVKGFGTVVTGTLVAGRVRVDDDLVLVPGERRVKVRGLQAHGETLAMADAGRRLAVNLAGVDLDEVRRGDTLTRPGALPESRVSDAVLQVLEGAAPLCHGARVRVHAGTAELLGRVAVSGLSGQPDNAGDTAPVAQGDIPAGARAHVRLRLEAPIVATRGDRFIVRAYSPPVTVAGGVVLDPAPARSAIRTAAGRARFAAIDLRGAPGETERFLAQVVSERGGLGVGLDELSRRAGHTDSELAPAVERLVQAGTVRRVGHLLASAAALEALSAKLVEAVDAYHRQQPLSEGLPREEARTRLFARADATVFDHVVSTLTAAGRLAGRERLSLPSRRPALSAEDEGALARVAEAFDRAGLSPPEAPALAASLGVPAETVARVITVLLRQRVLAKVDSIIFHASALDRLKAEIREFKGTAAGARLEVATVKDRYGITRKFAIPLLEYLDRERVTRRVGDARVVL